MNETHREYHPIASLFPLMDGNDFDALKADIAANGLREAIWLHQDGSILDGRNRHRACIETGVSPQFRTWSGSGSLIAFVVSLNLHRRHLTSSQRAVVALEILPMMEEEARERQGQRTDLTSVNKFTEVEPQRATQQAADIAQTNYKYVSDAKRLQTEAPDLLADVKRGDKSITKAKRELVRRQRKAEWEQVQNTPQLMNPDGWPKNIQLLTGDFAKIGLQLPAESFDLIITDPPYGKENVHLYSLLATQAKRLLKPGGSLLAMLGQLCLPETINVMTPHLNYHWIISYDTPGGQSPQIWPRKINTFWKPILWFVKGKYTGNWHGDKIKSDMNDKRFHEWGQSEGGIGKLVSEFTTQETSKVLDPFLGGGTTAVVCYRLRIPFVGIDISTKALETTRQRIIREVTNARS